MKIRVEIEDSITEDEVVIRCGSLNAQVEAIQKLVAEAVAGQQRFAFYKEDTEYYLPLQKVLFFETEGRDINVHTAGDIYQTKYKLYELESMLPGYFMRVSKSTIVNVNAIYSVTRNISACLVQFQNTHKTVYVSRYYYKPLKEKLDDRRGITRMEKQDQKKDGGKS